MARESLSINEVGGQQQKVASQAGRQAPFWLEGTVRPSRRGQFWVPGERVTVDGHSYQHGPMYVSWEAPENVTKPYPLVLIHGRRHAGHGVARHARWPSRMGATIR